MKKKIFLFAILAVTVAAALVILHSCEGLFDNGGGYNVKNGQFLYTDYDTDILLVGKTDDGDEVTILGTKDSQGYPKAITGFEYKEKGSKNSGTLTFEGNKVVKSETGNGVTMVLDYQSNGEVAVTMIDNETGEEFKTSVKPEGKAATDFSEQPGMRSGNATLSIENYAAPEEAAIVPGIGTKAATTKGISDGDVTGTIIVQNCGYPDDTASPFIELFQDNGFGSYNSKIGAYNATRVGKGEYEYTFPGSSTPHHEVSVAKFVKGVATLMGYICTAKGEAQGSDEWISLYLCPAIAGALGSGIVTAGAAAAFLAACESTILGLNIYCNTLGLSPSGGDDTAGVLADKFAETKISGILTVKWDEPIVVVPYLRGVLPLQGKAFTYHKGNKVQTTTFSNDNPTVAFFKLTPPAPSSGQSYNAEAGLKCIPAGSKATISIKGTDGYSDSKTETFEEDRLAVGVKLHVPGASKGVRDVCEIKVEMPGGKNLYKSASLVFGE